MNATRRLGALLLAVAAAAAAACSNPVSSSRHAHAEGVVVRLGNTELLRLHATQLTGGLTVPAGQEAGPLTVRFLDNNGNEIAPETGFWLDVALSNTAVAEWQQATPGEFGGRLTGKAAGTSGITFRLMHGAVGAGHEDWASQGLTVVVTAITTEEEN